MSKYPKHPHGLQGVPPFKPTPRFPIHPKNMTEAELNEDWERFHLRFHGEKDQEYRDHVSRMEYEIRHRGGIDGRAKRKQK